MGLRIDFLTTDGSPLGCSVKTLMGDDPAQVGVGGSEYLMLTLCELWTKQGHHVRLYNSPRQDWSSPFEQLSTGDFRPADKRDILIVFRSPNLQVVGANGMKIWLSTDQQTIGDFKSFRPLVDKVVGISEFHSDHFKKTYGISDMIVIDIPIRVWEYENKNIEKIKDRFIFTSVPARGLDILLPWWNSIKKEIPDASLVVTSDYRLWGVSCGMGNEAFIKQSLGLEDITFLSAVSRPKLVEEQLKAEINLYPNIYDELFCVAIAESQVAGAYPVTSEFGALRSTNMGTIIRLDPRDGKAKKVYIDASVDALNKIHSGEIDVKALQQKAIERFHPDNILRQWEEKVFGG